MGLRASEASAVAQMTSCVMAEVVSAIHRTARRRHSADGVHNSLNLFYFPESQETPFAPGVCRVKRVHDDAWFEAPG